MKRILVALTVALFAVSCANKHDQNITVVVSLDAFRWDYPQIYSTPWLDSIARCGVSAVMQPSYPSSTFPNHYTIATGLVPDHHGIVNSQFWDSERGVMYSMGDSLTRNRAYYYGGEPIWNTAERQGVTAASIYWVGSDIEIGGAKPSYTKYWYDEPRLTYAERVEEALRLLSLPSESRPRLLMVYFDDPDWVSHGFGPISEQTSQMVSYLDSLMGRLYTGIKSFDYADKVNLIVTADHGMTDISDDRFISFYDHIKPEWAERIVATNPTTIFSAQGCQDSILMALKDVEHIKAWKSSEVPSYLNYGTNPRLGDIVVAPDLGWQFASSPRTLAGAHGYDPLEPDMNVVFRATGPDFRSGYKMEESFVNVDIYPLLAHLLGVKPVKTDGKFSRIRPILAN